MKKISLLISCLLVLVYANAQKLVVTSPASSVRTLNFTSASPGGTGATPWGNVGITQIYQDIEVEIAMDNSATPDSGCQTLVNTTMTGKAALIKRGACEFGTKAKNAQAAGAAIAIIVNNDPLGFVSMGGGTDGAVVNIPVLMISKSEGDAIIADIDNGDTVKITLTPWGFGLDYDISVSRTGAFPSYLTQPKLLMDAAKTLGAFPEYTYYRGGARGMTNYSALPFDTLTGSNRVMNGSTELYADTAIWFDTTGIQPTSGTASGDTNISLRFFRDSFDLSTLALGSYTINNYFSPYPGQDGNPTDNMASAVYTVTTDQYSRTSMNSSGELNIDYTWTPGSPVEWGNTYYFPDAAGQMMSQVTVPITLQANSGSNDLTGKTFDVNVYEWIDANNDGQFRSTEFNKIGFGKYIFPAGSIVDPATNSKTAVVDLVGSPNPTSGIAIESNKVYWVAVSIVGSSSSHIGYAVDNSASNTMFYFNRDNASKPINSSGYYPQVWLSDTTVYSGLQGVGPMVMSLKIEKNTIGINDVAKNLGINIFPNPATSQELSTLQVKAENVQDYISYTVTDITGRQILSDKLENVKEANFSIDLRNQAPGSYFIRVSTPEGFTSEKLMKN